MPGRSYQLEFAAPESFREHLEAFLSAVDFSEPFILFTLAFHVLVFLLVIRTREYIKVQYFIFMGCLGICIYLEKLNVYFNENWRNYASQNYFDESGAFMSIFYGIPILGNCVLIIIFSLVNTVSLAVNVLKRNTREKLDEKARTKIEGKTRPKTE